MIPSMQKRALLSTVCASALLAACGGGSSNNNSSTQMGSVSFSMTDAPACGFDAVNVTVAKVRVHKSTTAGEDDAGWTDVTLNPARKINLLNLTNGVLEPLGQAPLEAGSYTQTRLVLVANSADAPFANSVVPSGGVETTLDTPSAVQSGIKLKHTFDVAPGTLADFTLDFDACKSIVTRGNGSFGLKPVIGVIPNVVSGTISGVVGAVPASARPVISAQINGVVVKSTVPDANGAFTLAPVVQSAAGAPYTVVITGDGYATSVIRGVTVTPKATTVLSTAAVPVAFSPSQMFSVSGNVLPVSAQGAVRVVSSEGLAGPLTVKYEAADLVSGAYAVRLPVAFPKSGDYGTGTLPIAFQSPAPVGAGIQKYTLEASAERFTTQSDEISQSTPSPLNFNLR